MNIFPAEFSHRSDEFLATAATDILGSGKYTHEYFHYPSGALDYVPGTEQLMLLPSWHYIYPYSGDYLDYIFDYDLLELSHKWIDKEFEYHKWTAPTDLEGYIDARWFYYGEDVEANKWFRHGTPSGLGRNYDYYPDGGRRVDHYEARLAKTYAFGDQLMQRRKYIDEHWYSTENNTPTASSDFRTFVQGPGYFNALVPFGEKWHYSTLSSVNVSIDFCFASDNSDYYEWDVYDTFYGYTNDQSDDYGYLTKYRIKNPCQSLKYIGSTFSPNGLNLSNFTSSTSRWGHGDYFFFPANHINGHPGDFALDTSHTGVNAAPYFVAPSGSQYSKVVVDNYPLIVNPPLTYNGSDIHNCQETVFTGKAAYSEDNVGIVFCVYDTNIAILGTGYPFIGVNIGGIPTKVPGNGEDQEFKRLRYISDAAVVSRRNFKVFYPENYSVIEDTTLQNRLGWFKELDGDIQNLQAELAAELRAQIPNTVYAYKFDLGDLKDADQYFPKPSYLRQNRDLSDFQVIWGTGWSNFNKTGLTTEGHPAHESIYWRFYDDLVNQNYQVLGDADQKIDIQPLMDCPGNFYLAIVPKDLFESDSWSVPYVEVDTEFTVPTPMYRLISYDTPANATVLYNYSQPYNNELIVHSVIQTHTGNFGDYSIFDIDSTKGFLPGSDAMFILEKWTQTTGSNPVYVGQHPATISDLYFLGNIGTLSTGPMTVSPAYTFTYKQASEAFIELGEVPNPPHFIVNKKIYTYSYEIPQYIHVELLRTFKIIFIGEISGRTHEVYSTIKQTYIFELINAAEIAAVFDQIITPNVNNYIPTVRPSMGLIPIEYEFLREYTLGLDIYMHGMSITRIDATVQNIDPNQILMGLGVYGDGTVFDFISTLNYGDSQKLSNNYYVVPDGNRHIDSIFSIAVSNDDLPTNLEKSVYPYGRIIHP